MHTNPYSVKTAAVSTITATETNTAGTFIERSVDGSLGGAYSPSTIVKFNNAGVGTDTVLSCGAASTATLAGTNVLSGSTSIASCTAITMAGSANVVLTSRSVNRQITLNAFPVSATWDMGSGGLWSNNAAAGNLIVPVERLPHGGVLQSVKVRLKGAGGHGALPSPMPEFTVYRVDDDGTATGLAAATVDSSATTGAYQAAHTITLSSIAHTVNLTTYRYFVKLVGEGVTNFVAGAELIQITVACDCVGYTEY